MKDTTAAERRVCGVNGTMLTIPGSRKHEKQSWTSERRRVPGDTDAIMRVHVRFDDECGNGHNSFGITATIVKHGQVVAGGCLHGHIKLAFPELAGLIKWHLCDTDGPLHYVANTTYLAGARDCYGLAEGEERPLVRRDDGATLWELVAINDAGHVPLYTLEKSHVGHKQPAAPKLVWREKMRVGEGKERELDKARSAAIWPDATDEQLCLPKAELTKLLEDRLPGLMAEMRADIEAAGFQWEPEPVAA